MRIRKNAILVEPPSVATGDIAFNLIVFFLVCASTQPDAGRKQELPRSEQQQEQEEKLENIQVDIARTTQAVNGDPVALPQFLPKLKRLLASRRKPEDRVVLVKSTKDTPYERWIQVTGLIEDAGGSITLQLEEEQTVIAQ